MLSVDIARCPVPDFRLLEKCRESRGWILDSASRVRNNQPLFPWSQIRPNEDQINQTGCEQQEDQHRYPNRNDMPIGEYYQADGNDAHSAYQLHFDPSSSVSDSLQLSASKYAS